MKNLRKMPLAITALLFVSLVFMYANITEACTGMVASGFCCRDNESVMVYKSRDSSAWEQNIFLIEANSVFGDNQIAKYKFLGTQTISDLIMYGNAGIIRSGINEKGVSTTTLAGYSWDCGNKKDVDSRLRSLVLANAADALGAIKHHGEIVKDGYYYGTSCGTHYYYGDPNEFWYRSDSGHAWASAGPFRHGYFSSSNFYRIPEMLKYQRGSGSGQNRAAKFDEYMYPIEGDITIEDIFKAARDPVISRGSTVSGTLFIGAKEYTDLLSVGWIAMGPVDAAPFVPYYIGITQIPTAYEDGTACTDYFFPIRWLTNAHPEYKDPVISIWEEFESKEMREAKELEKRVATLADAQQKEEAQNLLTEFVEFKAQVALDLAQMIIDYINAGEPPELLKPTLQGSIK
jgi:hypothetical protein